MSEAAPATNAAPATPATPLSAEPLVPGKIASMTPEDYRDTLLGSHGKEAKREADLGKAKEKASQDAAESEAKKGKLAQEPAVDANTKYELKLPQNARIDQAAVEEVVAFARAHGLSPKAAQAILERDNDAAAKHHAMLESHRPGGIEWTKKLDTYEQNLSRDPEFGRNDSERKDSLKAAQEALMKWFDPNLVQMLNDTGEGSNPLILKGLAKIGRAMRADTFVRGSVAPPPKADKPKSLEDMYSRKAEAV